MQQGSKSASGRDFRRAWAVFKGVTFGAVALGAVASVVHASDESLSGTGFASVDVAKYLSQYTRPTDIPVPETNPMTPEKVHLGKMLFFDPRLSGSGAISCGSCHNPSLGWQDGLALGVGDKGGQLGRHTPTILNMAWSGPMMWDGRAEDLEAQALGPVMSSVEMAGGGPELVLSRLSAIREYRDAMEKVFPGEGLTLPNVAKAIAAYERTVVSGEAPFDRWVSGDANAISAAAKRGFTLFNTKANCASCHAGWRFTDDGFHDIGLASEDIGRGKFLPGVTVLEHAFKTPTLRNIAQRGPYMHDGSVATLEAVVDHYDHGFVKRPSLSEEVHPLNLSAEEKADLVAFMQTLTSKDAPVEYPVLPR
ncbi:MAG: cytochrome c peroxidase [Sphingomonas sp.]|jgi:cytochrome c peroxidase